MVVMFWSIVSIVVVAYVYIILYYTKKIEPRDIGDNYSKEVTEKARIIMKALKTQIIKKHIITNSAKEYDSKKAREYYRDFLQTSLMKDIMLIDEDGYNG